MYRLLRFLFIGEWELPKKCEHKWETFSKEDVTIYGRRTGTCYHLKCKKCGELHFTQS